MLFTIWVIFHVITCIALIVVVLLQSAKGEGLAGSAFGGGGGGGMGGAVFGGRGAASFLSNATTVLAVVFMVNCMALAFMSSSSRVGMDYSPEGDSPITRQAQEEYERSQQAQQQRVADSLATASGQDTSVSLENLVPANDDQPEAESTDGN